MKLKFQSMVNLLSRVFWEKNMSSSDSVDKKNHMQSVQSDLDLLGGQKVIMLCLKVQGLIHPRLNDVLSDLWCYYE